MQYFCHPYLVFFRILLHYILMFIIRSIFRILEMLLINIYLQKYLINFRELLLKRKINQLDRL